MSLSTAGDQPDWANNNAPAPVVPNDYVSIIRETGGPWELLAVPTQGAWYLFGVDISSTSGGGWFNIDDSGDNDIAYVTFGAGDYFATLDLGGIRVADAVYCNSDEIDFSIVLRYAAGP